MANESVSRIDCQTIQGQEAITETEAYEIDRPTPFNIQHSVENPVTTLLAGSRGSNMYHRTGRQNLGATWCGEVWFVSELKLSASVGAQIMIQIYRYQQ